MSSRVIWTSRKGILSIRMRQPNGQQFNGREINIVNGYHKAGNVLHKPTPPKEFLKNRFDYDPEIGSLILRRTGKPSRIWVHKKNGKSVWRTVIGDEKFRHCRLVWAWHYDDPAELQIDHIDGNRRNDRITNLRLATNSQNNANKSSLKGYRKTESGKFFVDVMKDGKHYRGGTFAREADAAKAAMAIRKILHGEFASARPLTHCQFMQSQPIIQLSLFD